MKERFYKLALWPVAAGALVVGIVLLISAIVLYPVIALVWPEKIKLKK